MQAAKPVAPGRAPKSPQVAPQATPQVTPRVLARLQKVSVNTTRQQLTDVLRLKDRKHFADAYLQPAMAAGLLATTISDKPRSRSGPIRWDTNRAAMSGTLTDRPRHSDAHGGRPKHEAI